ncbi:hypothetical protein ASJ33_05440 [Dehalococcoides mccartyi]|jgi:hypothetical protein|uniref:hypothetical protein n=1 Tax=Dehalococcoides mccartyi TaxID=61435 RepID=UPI0004E0686E|nr:hypothetical protein [Dehalococcoides mccartyi]AII58705.1 hypothetical protein X792_04860 [Dehalococcoides mccartyi CG1]APH12632.1 hypothetical protein ASJ33_05440 [Dehalococcoides mccartyi]
MKELTCSHCGHTGSDVHEVNSYIGGQGYVEIPLCDDGKECWKRWDVQHGIRKPELVGAK